MERDKSLNDAVLLIVNGWGFGSSIWKGFLECLYEELGFQMDTDFINWSGIESMACFGERLEAKLDYYEGREVVIMGWSLGAIASIPYLNRARSAVLISPTFRFIRKGKEILGWDLDSVEAMRLGFLKDRHSVASSFAGKLVSKRESSYINGVRSCMEEDNVVFSLKDLELGLEFLKAADMEEYVSSVQTSTLLVHGRRDRIVPFGRSNQMKEMNGKMEVFMVDDSGHLPFYTNSEYTALHMADHIRRSFYDRQEEA